MIQPVETSSAMALAAEHDRKNLAAIADAYDAGMIDDIARRYLERLYSDGMHWFREMFYVLGKCFGAPKGYVMEYDYATDTPVDRPIKISDISPLHPYLVSHRLDADPMRNQFFTSGPNHKIDLSVSSIVTVIVGAQKSFKRALTKMTGKYYDDYVNEVAECAARVIERHQNAACGRATADKIQEKFHSEFISAAAEAVLAIIGRGHEDMAVELVRELDKIDPPHMRLQDVWRVKCLFDLIPQARTFIERIQKMSPDRILTIRDRFFDMDNPRNYRDAKLIIDIGTDGHVVPMEIICQVRTFFEFERKTHKSYEVSRKKGGARGAAIERRLADFMAAGLREYNTMVYHCLGALFERIGWNILYNQGGIGASLFEGFPRLERIYYPTHVVEKIYEKLDNAIENEVLTLTNSPANLTSAQKSQILHWMTRFILVSAMPYTDNRWSVPSDTDAGKLFNFVMRELSRYYKRPATA